MASFALMIKTVWQWYLFSVVGLFLNVSYHNYLTCAKAGKTESVPACTISSAKLLSIQVHCIKIPGHLEKVLKNGSDPQNRKLWKKLPVLYQFLASACSAFHFKSHPFVINFTFSCRKLAFIHLVIFQVKQVDVRPSQALIINADNGSAILISPYGTNQYTTCMGVIT